MQPLTVRRLATYLRHIERLRDERGRFLTRPPFTAAELAWFRAPVKGD